MARSAERALARRARKCWEAQLLEGSGARPSTPLRGWAVSMPEIITWRSRGSFVPQCDTQSLMQVEAALPTEGLTPAAEYDCWFLVLR